MTAALQTLTLAQESGGGGIAATGIVILLLALAAGIYTIVMLVNAIKTDESQYKTGSKVVWVLVILLTGFIGALIYQFVGKPDTA